MFFFFNKRNKRKKSTKGKEQGPGVAGAEAEPIVTMAEKMIELREEI